MLKFSEKLRINHCKNQSIICMNILIFKHITDEPAGFAEQWAIEKGHQVTHHYWSSDNILSMMPDFDLLIIMGGMMGAYEEETYPWLIQEKKIIREAVKSNRKVLGICLGAQLIASAMGAHVYKNVHSEIGFHSIQPTTHQLSREWFSGISQGAEMFQWHGDTFDLPENAHLLASSEHVKHQAFVIGNNTIALQFHPEMNEHIVEGLIHSAYNQESPSPWKQSTEIIKQKMQCVQFGKQFLYQLLDKLTEL